MIDPLKPSHVTVIVATEGEPTYTIEIPKASGFTMEYEYEEEEDISHPFHPLLSSPREISKILMSMTPFRTRDGSSITVKKTDPETARTEIQKTREEWAARAEAFKNTGVGDAYKNALSMTEGWT